MRRLYSAELTDYAAMNVKEPSIKNFTCKIYFRGLLRWRMNHQYTLAFQFI